MVATNTTAKKTAKTTRQTKSAEKIAQSTEQKLVQLLADTPVQIFPYSRLSHTDLNTRIIPHTDQELEEMADSIQAMGILQNLIGAELPDGTIGIVGGDRAIIYDSGCTFTETHYNPSTDIILNAHDERCANWQMWGECVDAVDYDNLAASLIPVEGESDPFWVSSSRTIYADLAIRMSTDPERSIEKFLKTLLSLSMKNLRDYLANTPSANLVEEKIEKTAISIRSVVTNYAKALR